MSFHTASRIKPSRPAESATEGHRAKRHLAGSVTPVVHHALSSPGRPLESSEREFMESRFNHDFSGVHLHTDEMAVQSARAVNARAYTVSNHIVFGEGKYQPTSRQGRRLLAHELAHVVQQERGGDSAGAEARADRAAERATHARPVSPEVLKGASPGLYADNGEEEGTPTPAPARETRPAFSIGWIDMARLGMFESTPPSLLVPPPRRLSLGTPVLGSPTSPVISGPALPAPSITPSAGTEGGSSAPSMPSRLPVMSRGRFSLGLRLGFPEIDSQSASGMPESALAASLRRATIMNQIVTGNVPSGWEALDKGKLAQAIWGIFSTNIAPDLARSITSGFSTPAGPAGLSYELDVVLLTDFSSEIGGGLSFTVRFPSFESLFTGRQK